MKKILLLLLIIGLISFGVINTFDGVVQYSRNFGSEFTSRSLVDRGWSDSARNKARDSVTTLLSTYKTIADYNSDTTSKTWAWTDITGKPSFTQSKSITVESPTASENIGLWRTDAAIVLDKSAFVIKGSSPSVTVNINFASDRSSGSPTKVWGTDQTFTSTTTGDIRTSLNTAIPAGSWIWLTTSAVGTVTEFTMTLYYD